LAASECAPNGPLSMSAGGGAAERISLAQRGGDIDARVDPPA
jgi:hypothetical protein